MILIEPREGQWSIPLTVRPQHLPDHAGQVCLPGGRLEPGESHALAAQREFCEELGLEDFPAHILGPLQSLWVFNSDFHLTPYLAVAEHTMTYRPSPSEVAQIVHLPVAHLLDTSTHNQRQHQRGQVRWSALGIDVADQHIWGATAMVLGELAELLRPLFVSDFV
jgi:8-oxo-dGTP pyrophosphatase MutT (NUDIX family)